MLSVSNHRTGTIAAPTAGPSILTGSEGEHVSIWCATARQPIDTPTGGAGFPIEESTRTATTCFMKGLAMNDTVIINNTDPWYWRRILFRMKTKDIVNATTSANYPLYLETSIGYSRVHNFDSPSVAPAESFLFRGIQGTDWQQRLIAFIDTRRVDLVSDKTIIINSEGGPTVRRTKTYTPLNKNFVYDDDENGGQENSNAFSVMDKQGMGDLYVYDLFGSYTATTGQLSWTSEATLYWHEK